MQRLSFQGLSFHVIYYDTFRMQGLSFHLIYDTFSMQGLSFHIIYDTFSMQGLSPTSPLGDRWFRTCVSASIPQLLHSMLSVLEGGFTPPPTSSPGSKIVVPNPVIATYIQLFRYPGHHHFFIIFSTPFFINVGLILDPNLERKSLQNRIWSRFFQRPKLLRTIFRILKDVSHGMHGFEVPRPREQLQKSIQFREKSFQKGNTIYDIFWTYFFLDFYGFWAPSCAPFFL